MDCRQRSVLVVDDEPTISDLVSTLLEIEGYEVKTAWNGQDALDQLEAWQPDLIVLDMLMPVMDGTTFLQTKQASPRLRDIPVIGMSASLRRHESGTRFPTEVMLSKPFRIDDLVAHVAAQLGCANLVPA
jgi:CheY-like chemotaxis protein